MIIICDPQNINVDTNVDMNGDINNNINDDINRMCIICLDKYPIKNPNKVKNYCGRKCRLRGVRWKNLTSEEIADKLAKIGVTHTCQQCDIEFIAKKETHTKFCSRDCHDKMAIRDLANKREISREVLKKSRMEQGKCANCDETDIRLFEFAHNSRDIKEIDVQHCFNIDKLKNEFTKGRWLCVWCHRIETYNEIVATRVKIQGREYIKNTKMKIGKCALCHVVITKDTIVCFDFDHSTKYKNIAQLTSHTANIIQTEIDKCRLLCCKCHRLHTIEQEKENRETNKITNKKLAENRKAERQSKINKPLFKSD